MVNAVVSYSKRVGIENLKVREKALENPSKQARRRNELFGRAETRCIPR